MFIAWAVGGRPYYFPSHTGYPLGGPNRNLFMVIQIHYDNPTQKSGIIDNSRIRMLLTPKLRQYVVGAIVVRHSVTPFQKLPPHEQNFITSGYCTDKCVNRILIEENINEFKIMAVLQHAHLLTSGIRTRHFRNVTELEPIYDDPHYEFYFQEVRVVCLLEEMFESIMYYYPKTRVMLCDSMPDLNAMFNTSFENPWTGGTNSFTSFVKKLFDWGNITQREEFRNNLEATQQIHRCVSSNDNNPADDQWIFEERETEYIPYVPPKPACNYHQ